MVGYLIVADWQTIPYDPCTEFSPYHHPRNAQELNNSDAYTMSSRKVQGLSMEIPNSTSISFLTDINISTGTDSLSFKVDFGLRFKCKQTKSCNCDELPSKCLRFTADDSQSVRFGTGPDQETYQCSSHFEAKPSIMFCVLLSRNTKRTSDFPSIESSLETADSNLFAEINNINVLPKEIYHLASNSCIQANVTGHQCHWIPFSDIAKKECEDCQPICRSVHQTLTFPQYVIGNCLLMVSSALQFVSIVALLMNQSPEQIQVF